MLPVALALTFSLVCLGVTAQDPPEAAPPPPPQAELAALERLIGHWQGGGKVTPQPGAPTADWRGTAVAAKVLGGQWIQLDQTIEFAGEGAAALPNLAMRTFYGFDRQTNRYVAHSINNTGSVESVEVFVEGDQISYATVTVHAGKPVLAHWTTEFTEDGYRLLSRESIAGGELFTHVEGTMTRAGNDVSAKPVDAAFPTMPPTDPAPMRRLAKTTGSYRMTGSMVMAPEQPALPLSGSSEVRTIWGGTILEMEVTGDAPPGGEEYHGYGACGWNARQGSYTLLWVDSMGQASTSTGHWVGDDLVLCSLKHMMGVPCVQRGVIKLNDDGSFATETWHALTGVAKPYVLFEATYEKQG